MSAGWWLFWMIVAVLLFGRLAYVMGYKRAIREVKAYREVLEVVKAQRNRRGL